MTAKLHYQENNMRKIVAFNLITLDGFFEGPNREIDWHVVDEEFNDFAIDQLKTVDTILFGRVTYQMMAQYWPTPAATTNDPVVAGMMNSLPKIVFSRTLDKVEWQNTTLIKENINDEVLKLKQQPGKDIVIFGSNDLMVSLATLGSIDEYRVMVNPIVLGKGNPLFKGLSDKLKLKLLKTRTFTSGNVLLYYQPDIA
jgi:dihydrofolate reductase